MTPIEFERVSGQVQVFRWRPELNVEAIPSPQRIAPHSLAIEADLTTDGREVGSGRLIILHDPQGNDAWDGTFRCVSYARADVDFDMVADPLLSEVGWSWLTEALENNAAEYRAASGTVTTMTSRGFGGIASEPDRAEVEIRASWTAVLHEEGMNPHLAAWQSLLCLTAGLPQLPEGITPLTPRLTPGRLR